MMISNAMKAMFQRGDPNHGIPSEFEPPPFSMKIYYLCTFFGVDHEANLAFLPLIRSESGAIRGDI